MPDLKFQQLSTGTPLGTDIFPFVTDPAGSPADRKTTFTAALSALGGVVGPASSTDNAIARFDGTTGKLLQNSLIIGSDNGDIFTPGIIASGNNAVISSTQLWNFAHSLTSAFPDFNTSAFRLDPTFTPTADVTGGKNLVGIASNFRIDGTKNVGDSLAKENYMQWNSSGTLSNATGDYGDVENVGAGTITNATGGAWAVFTYGAGGIGTAVAVNADIGTYGTGTDTMGDTYMFKGTSPFLGGGAITGTSYGLHLGDQDVSVLPGYAIYTEGGKVQFEFTSRILTGSQDYTCLDLEITNANHTGLGNTLRGLNISGIAFDAQVTATAINIESGGWNYALALPTNIGILFGTLNMVFDGTNIAMDGPILISGNMVVSGTISSAGAGANSEKFGLSSLAAGTSALALGNSASAADTNTIAIGKGAAIASGGLNTIVIGQGISTSSADGVTIGNGASNWKQSVTIGSGASAGGQDSIGIGRGVGGGLQTVMLGSSASGSGTNNIGIGYNISVTGSAGASDSIGIGANAITGFTNVIVFGSSAIATAANQALIGGASTSITSVYFGKGVTSATPLAVTLQSTGGNASGIVGADFILAGGLGGAAADSGGSILIKTASAGSGTTLSTKMIITPAGNIGIGTSSTGASMTNGFSILNGTAPSGNVTDAFQLYSADQAAGNAAPHFRTENGDVVKLFKSSAYTITNVTTDRSYDANSTTLDELADTLGTLVSDLQATGLIG